MNDDATQATIDAEPRRPERRDWSALALALLASLGVLAALWVVDYLPTHDGPQHVLLGHLQNHFHDEGSAYAKFLEPGHPLTALGFGFVFSLAEQLFPWRTALRLALSVITLTWAFGYFTLVATLHPRRAILGLLGFASAISWALYMGFFSYVFGMGVGFFILSIALKGTPWTPKRRGVLAGLLLVEAIIHAFSAQLTGLVLLALVLAQPKPPRVPSALRWRFGEVGLLALMGLPVLAITLSARTVATGPTEWLSMADRLAILPRTFLPGPAWRSGAVFTLAALGLGLAAHRLRQRRTLPAERGLLIAAALCLALTFTLPMHLAGWELFAPRFLPAGCLLAAALLPIEQLGRRYQRAALAGMTVLTGASLAVAIRMNQTLREHLDAPLSGLAAPVHRTGLRLFVSFDHFVGLGAAPFGDNAHGTIPYFGPALNLGALYAVEQGGLPSYGFLKDPNLHPFVVTQEARRQLPGPFLSLADPVVRTNPETRSSYITYLARVGMGYEDVTLWGLPSDGDTLLERGYEQDFRHGGLLMAHFKGCPTKVEIRVPPPHTGSVFIEYGFVPMPEPMDRVVLTPDGIVNDTLWFDPTSTLCGPAWLRVALDSDGSNGRSPGDRLCKGADRNGRLRLIAAAGATLVCEL